MDKTIYKSEKQTNQNWKELKFRICVYIDNWRFKIVYILIGVEDIHKQSNINESEKKNCRIVVFWEWNSQTRTRHMWQNERKKTHTFTKMIYHMTKFLSVFFLAPQNRNLNHSIKYKAFFYNSSYRIHLINI